MLLKPNVVPPESEEIRLVYSPTVLCPTLSGKLLWEPKYRVAPGCAQVKDRVARSDGGSVHAFGHIFPCYGLGLSLW